MDSVGDFDLNMQNAMTQWS